jgi:hypothetical protein
VQCLQHVGGTGEIVAVISQEQIDGSCSFARSAL